MDGCASHIRDCKRLRFAEAFPFPILMLKKLFAKLRSKMAPEGGEKPASADRGKAAQGKPAGGTHGQGGQGNRGGGHGRSGGAGSQGRRERGHSGSQSGKGGSTHGGKGGGHGGGGHGGSSERKARHERGPRHESHGGKHSRSEAYEHPRRESIKPAVPVDVPKMDTAFSQLGLNDALAFAVQEMGYVEPTPIQKQAIPVVLRGGDVIGSAQTGTGKTAAFALPIIQRLAAHGSLRCLILEPTRELALQVEEAFHKYAKFTDLRVTIVYGGVGYGKQVEDLRRGMDILAATPGRLLDHLDQRNCSLDQVEILVLDEVDRMLDMGFLPDVKRIVQRCPKQRQTLFFTATLPPEIEQLASWALHDPVKVEIGRVRSPAETVAHAFYPVVASQKFDLLQVLLERTEFKSVLIFCRTRMGADRIAHRLIASGHTVGVMHSDRSQRERIEALDGFKSGRFEVLVATDIAARGLDIAGVSHVINYDVPENAEDYVHRIGRTGRAQNTGDAFTLVTEEDVRDARSIERYMGVSVERKKLEDFPYIYSALFDDKALAEGAAPKPASRLHRGIRR